MEKLIDVLEKTFKNFVVEKENSYNIVIYKNDDFSSNVTKIHFDDEETEIINSVWIENEIIIDIPEFYKKYSEISDKIEIDLNNETDLLKIKILSIEVMDENNQKLYKILDNLLHKYNSLGCF